jgi:hypothetical protein
MVNVELVICPLCAEVVHRHVRGAVTTRIRVQPLGQTSDVFNALIQMASTEHAEEMADAERACVTHFKETHRLRYSLWRRFGWKRLLTWPGRRYDVLPEDQTFEPLAFMKRNGNEEES